MKNINKSKKYIIKNFYKILFTSILSFLICFIALGTALSFGLNYVLLKNTDKEILEYENIINRELRVTYDKFTGRKMIDIGKAFNPKIKVIFYNAELEVEALSNSLFSYVIDGYAVEFHNEFGSIQNFDYEQAISHQIFQINDKLRIVNNFEKTTSKNTEYYFKTYSFKINNNEANMNDFEYCKVLVMVNDFIDMKNGILNIYFLSGIILILCGLIASIILSKKAVKPALEAFDKQTMFVADASHELKTPLTIIKSNLEKILMHSDQKVIDVSEDVATSLNEITRLNKLVNDLLELSKNDNGEERLYFEQNINIKNIIEETAKPFIEYSEIVNKKFTLALEDVTINCDPAKIKQLLIIFFDNAIKYTLENDAIDVVLSKNNSEAIIKICDTGIGIKGDKKYIFERFYRENKARSRENGGNGLGLAIAKTIIDNHKGKINVINNEPKGTIFIITLPRK